MSSQRPVGDSRAVDPVTYIRSVGLRPEDSLGFLPLDIDTECSFAFFYRDRPEYAERRASLPEATRTRQVDLGVVSFRVGGGRQEQLPSSYPTAMGFGGDSRLGQTVAWAQQLQQAYGGQGGAEAYAAGQAEQMRAMHQAGMISDEQYHHLMGLMAASGLSAPEPERAPEREHDTSSAEPPEELPDLVVDRVYPGLVTRSTREQLPHFLPDYCRTVGLTPEDTYGVFPRNTRLSSRHEDTNRASWDDYCVVYRDRPEYAAGRDRWAAAMAPKPGRMSSMMSSLSGEAWPGAQRYPGVAPSAAGGPRSTRVETSEQGWPRRMLRRQRGNDLVESILGQIGRLGYAPEQSFGICPEYDAGKVFHAWARG